MVCFRNDIITKNFAFPKAMKLTKHVEDFLLEDTSLTEHLYVNRVDIYYNDTKDDVYSNKSIRLGIVNKGGQGERIYSTKGRVHLDTPVCYCACCASSSASA